MFTKFIAKNIQEKLKARERALARENRSANQESVKDSLTMNDIATRTVFVRMCSNKSEVPNIVISGGEQENGEIKFGFYNVYKYSESSGIKGVAGIKDISVEYKGGYKAVRECVVNWTVGSIQDLNRLTPYFLSVGKTVVVDWGWTNANLDDFSKQDVKPYITKNENGLYEVNQEIFTNPQKNILESNGDYDAMGGKVTNFNYSLREDGSFDCTTTIQGLGSFLLDKEIDLDGNSVGTRKANSESKPKFAPPDSMINCILNLRDIIFFEVLGAPAVRPRSGRKGKVDSQAALLSNENNLIYFDDSGRLKGRDLSGRIEYGIAADNQENPNILYMVRKGREDIMVTWGWFEDQILNRYLSFKGGSEDGSGIKMTMRSIDTVLDIGSDTSTNAPISLIGLDDNQIEGLEEKYNVSLQELSKLGNVLKTDTLIRNSKMLYGINPFDFHIIDNTKVFQPEQIKGIKTADASFDLYTSKLSKRDRFFINFLRLGTNDKFKFYKKNFSEDPNGIGKGKLRNIFINIRQIQEAFGVKDTNSKRNTQNNVTPPGTFKIAIERLLSAMNDNFHNIWNFDIVVDQFDTTNIKVIDKSDTNTKNPEYTKFAENSHKVQETGIYTFPSFKIGSIVKNQTLEFKIPTAQQISILYGANKKKGESDIQSTDYDKLFRLDEVEGDSDPYSDKFFKDSESANLKVSQLANENAEEDTKPTVIESRQVGSENANPNSPIQEDRGIITKLDKGPYNWRTYKSNASDTEEEQTPEDETVSNFEIVTEEVGGQPVKKLRYVTKKGKEKSESVSKPFYKLNGDDLVLLSGAQKAISSYLNASSKIAIFDTNSLIPAELGLEVDGVGGILPGDIIHTDYIQNKYKLPLTVVNPNILSAEGPSFPAVYFKVMGTIQKVDISGWTTEIRSQMIMNKLPPDLELEFKTPVDKPKSLENKQDFVPEEVEKPFIPVPTPEIELEGDQELEDLDFGDDIPEFTEIPVPVNRPNIPVPEPPGEDIADDVELDDLDFDEIPPWTPPPFPSTIDLRNARAEIELQPESVPEPPPPDVPLLDIGPIMSEEDFLNPPDNLGQDASDNPTDLLEYPLEPEPTVPASQGSAPIVGNPPEVEATSKEEQLQTQKIIYVHPSPELTNETGQVPKAQRFETPTFEEKEIDYGNPIEATIEVNKNIRVQVRRKATLPPSLIMGTQEVVDLKSTYRGTKEQNEILYSIREDWRPLYLQANGKPGGSEKDSNDNLQTLLRERLSFSTRQRFWDQYIEEPNRTGVTKATKNTLYSSTPIPKNLMRTQRSIYWRGSFNPNYSGG